MRRLLTYSLLLFTVLSFAQAKQGKDKYLDKGNTEFRDNNYVNAEADYRVSQSNSPTAASGAYNLGNAIYRQGQTTEAAYAYGEAIRKANTKQQKHMAYHNFGNVLMKQKDYQGAVEAYKNALRNDPTDDESRYNLAVAKKMLKNNPPKDDKKDKDKNKDKDKDQPKPNKDNKSQKPENDKGDNKDKGSEGDSKDKGQDKSQEGDSKDKAEGDSKEKSQGDSKDKSENESKQNNGKPKPQQGNSPSKQQMENLLDAMNNEEKKTQNKVKAQKARVKEGKQEKDW